LAGAFLIIIQPVEPQSAANIGRVARHHVLGGLQAAGTVPPRCCSVVESLTATFSGPSWAPAVSFGFAVRRCVPAGRIVGALTVRAFLFYLFSILVGGLFFVFARWLGNDYLFFAGYTVLQFIVLATAWNILGGYCGYVNFGSAAFFAVGAYASVAMHKLGAGVDRYFPESIAASEADPAAEYPDHHPRRHHVRPGRARHRLACLFSRGAFFFAIATLALAVVLQTRSSTGTLSVLARRSYHPSRRGAHPSIQYFVPGHARAVGCIGDRTHIEQSCFGYGFATIRDGRDRGGSLRRADAAFEADRHHHLRRADGHGRRAVPYYCYLEPVSSAFGLAYAVNSIAMPMIGGTTSWSAFGRRPAARHAAAGRHCHHLRF
jgi:branched-chain amino acid transport system permease protein